MSIRFICDSTCDYTEQQAKELGITLVPLKVLFGEKEYFDGVDIKPEAFYDMLADSEELPTTSQPSPEAFLQYFREAKEAGDDVICIDDVDLKTAVRASSSYPVVLNPTSYKNYR